MNATKTVGIEVITNCKCNNFCPGCNQSPFMQYDKTYEFNEDDAEYLISNLKKYNYNAKLFLSGGEPGLWSKRNIILSMFKKCENIIFVQVATSLVTKENIENLLQYCDKIGVSVRNNFKENIVYGDTSTYPEYLKNNKIWMWDQRLHAVEGEKVQKVNCACASQGIECCLIGKNIYACTLAKSLQLSNKWKKGESEGSVKLEEYLKSNKNSFNKKIAEFEACKICCNNSYFRAKAKKKKTYYIQ